MKILIIFVSLLFLTSCSVYESVKENAADAYEWTKDKANDVVDGVDEAASE